MILSLLTNTCKMYVTFKNKKLFKWYQIPGSSSLILRINLKSIDINNL